MQELMTEIINYRKMNKDKNMYRIVAKAAIKKILPKMEKCIQR